MKNPLQSPLTGRMCAASVQLVGAKTAEEKEQERVEEQKVIEARIREREVRVLRHSCTMWVWRLCLSCAGPGTTMIEP